MFTGQGSGGGYVDCYWGVGGGQVEGNSSLPLALTTRRVHRPRHQTLPHRGRPNPEGEKVGWRISTANQASSVRSPAES